MPEENIPRNASNTTVSTAPPRHLHVVHPSIPYANAVIQLTIQMGEMTPSDSVDSFWESLLGPSPETPPVFDEFGERIDPEVVSRCLL
jgi:hypothetical protein